MKRIKVILVFGLTFASLVYSQTKEWTLVECIDYALAENISILQKKLNSELDQITLEQSKANKIPSINASGSQSFNFGRSVDPYTNIYTQNNFASNNIGLNANWEVFSGFQNKNTIVKNEIDLKTGDLEIRETENNITLSITQAYLQVLYSYEQIDNFINKLESTRAQVKRTEALLRAGEVPEGNLFQIRAQEATDQYNLINAENQLKIAKVSLMQLMELPVLDDFEVYQPDFKESIISLIILESSGKIFESALKTQPEIERSGLKVNSAEQSLKIAKGASLPRLIVSGGINTGFSNNRNLFERESYSQVQEIGYLQSDPTEIVLADQQFSTLTQLNYPVGQQFTDNFAQSLRLSLSIPIFSNKQIKSNIARSRINIETAKLNQQDTKNILRKKIEQAYNDMIAAAKNHDAAKEQLKNLERSFSDSKRKYELGMINATDFIIEQNQYFDSESNLIRAKYQYIFMSKILEFYKGVPISLE